MRKDLKEAANIVEKLQVWIEDRDNLSVCPIASLSWSTVSLQIMVGDAVVYDGNSSGEENLTLEMCKREWIEHIRDMHIPFAVECSR